MSLSIFNSLKSARTRSNKRSQAEKYKEWSRSQPNVCIITRGSVSDQIRRLEEDLRTVFQPLTFVNSAKFSGAKMKELARTLPALKASHLLAITESECHVTLRMAKVPAGPTLTFRIPQWALRSDVACLGPSAAGDMPKSFFASSHPFLITSNFDADVPHEKILSVTLQNLFPNFDIEESDLKAFKRCAIFHRDAETGDIEFRH